MSVIGLLGCTQTCINAIMLSEMSYIFFFSLCNQEKPFRILGEFPIITDTSYTFISHQWEIH